MELPLTRVVLDLMGVIASSLKPRQTTSFSEPLSGGTIMADKPKTHASEESPLRLSERLALRTHEVAAVLGVSERTVRGMLPELPHTYFGRCLVFPTNLLREWLDDRVRTQAGQIENVSKEILKAIEATPDD